MLREVDERGLRDVVRDAEARLVLVNLWATWCPPCVDELPDLVRVARAYRGRGLALRTISVDEPADRARAGALLERLRVPRPHYVQVGSDAGFIGAFGEDWGGALPATGLFAADGTLVAFWEGPVDYGTLEEVLEFIEWP